MTVTKAELANTLFEEVGLNKREAKEIVELFFEKIREGLESGKTVKLSGFGGFGVRDKRSDVTIKPTIVMSTHSFIPEGPGSKYMSGALSSGA